MAKVTNIFNFLKDYNDIRNPVITDIGKQIWSYKLLNLPYINELWSIYNMEDFDNLKILEIERPTILPCPPPDKIIRDWVDSSWDKLSVKEIKYIESKTKSEIDENNQSFQKIEYFTDNRDRIHSYNTWIEKRNIWLETEGPKEIGLNFYNDLFSLYSSFKRESESLEIALGDGFIKWTTEGRVINHPVLLQKVNLEFNSNKPSFIISCDEIKTELYTPMLRVIKSINQTMLSEIIKEVEEQNFHIADKNNNIGIFKRLINVINKSGKYVEDKKEEYFNPVITHEPILFLRKRNLGFTEFINKIIADVESNEDIILPDFFEILLGNYKEENNNEVIEDNWNQSGIDEDVLLTLPANNEQTRIIRYLDNYGAVLVQGPPGTGKTHTIANLIGHLLSRGDSVLVTSHTEKALTVLKDKVYKELQSLCISLLSSSSERKEMDATLFEIAEKSTSLDQNCSLKKINKLEKERNDLINLYKAKTAALLQVRSFEYNDIVYGNTTIRPIDAAKFIKDGEHTLNIIPGNTADDAILLPLSIEDIEYLYKSNGLIDNDEEIILSKDLPDIDHIWTSEELRINMDNIVKYEKQLEGWTSDFLFIDEITEDRLMELLNFSKKITGNIEKMDDFEKSIINKSIIDSMYRKFWEDIFHDFDSLKIDYAEYRRTIFYNDYNIPKDLYSLETIGILDEIIATEKDIPVNLMIGIVKPKWKKLKDSINNNRKTIEKIQEYKEVKLIISYILKKEEIISRINKLNFELAVRDKLDNNETEDKIETLLNTVRSSLDWYQGKWISFMNELEKFIINFEEFNNSIKINIDDAVTSMYDLSKDYFSYNINNYYTSLLLKESEDYRVEFLALLNQYSNYGEPFNGLVHAVQNIENDDYYVFYNKLLEIYSKKEIFIKRYEILGRLENYAKGWARAIKGREGIHGETSLPKDIELAWKWKQLSNQLDRINGYDSNKIQKEIQNINKKLMENAKELAYEKAWYNKITNNTPEQTQAIEGWRQTMRLIGRGTGRQAPMLREKARRLMPLCQTAIPVWIMPLNRVAENFNPETNKFDVIIIDEASQADILALSALYLGKKIIIVGDDEQVSPESVGIKVDEVTALAEQHLQGIPNNHLFNSRTSIYDMAKTSGFKPIMLVEHFRCLPEIIEFSNQLSYNGKIKPLRDASGVDIKPAVIEYRLPNGYRNERKINPIEADHIASLICACIEDEAFKRKTIGVISLLGHEQAYEIDRILQTRLEPKEYEDRKIQCGTSAQFQGDERDIIFLSVVDGPKEGGGPLRLLSQDGNNDINRKRYNVAASRAKDQMWIVHSLNPEIDLQPDDIRLRLIKHAINPKINKDEEILSRTESDFEQRVMKYLLNKGYKVYPQWQVGAYRIDMVVEYGDKRVALECDGERWHTQDDLENDLKRQAILERLGWKFIRIRGSAFYRNPESTMKWVYDELENDGIRPNFSIEGETKQDEVASRYELIDKIKVRAEALRREWNVQEDELELQDRDNIEDDTIKDDTIKDNIIYSRISDTNLSKMNNEGIGVEDEQKKEKLENVKLTVKPLFDFRKKQL